MPLKVWILKAAGEGQVPAAGALGDSDAVGWKDLLAHSKEATQFN